jgi:hypothetical protein
MEQLRTEKAPLGVGELLRAIDAGDVDAVLSVLRMEGIKDVDVVLRRAVAKCPDTDRQRVIGRALDACLNKDVAELLRIMQDHDDPAVWYIYNASWPEMVSTYSKTWVKNGGGTVAGRIKKLTGPREGIKFAVDGIEYSVLADLRGDDGRDYILRFLKGLGTFDSLKNRGLHVGSNIEAYGVGFPCSGISGGTLDVQGWTRKDQ